MFTFNEGRNSWYNEVTKHSIQLGGGHNAIIKQKFKDEPEFQWTIINCEDFKELPKSHRPEHDNDSGAKGDRDIRDHDEEEEEDDKSDKKENIVEKPEKEGDKKHKNSKKQTKKELDSLMNDLKTPAKSEEKPKEEHHHKKQKVS